jgi:hypothetical protein
VSCRPICPKPCRLNLLLSSKMALHSSTLSCYGWAETALGRGIARVAIFHNHEGAFDEKILEPHPTLGEFLALVLSKGTNLLSCLTYSRHWEKLVAELLQQFFLGCNRSRSVGIQPLHGSIMKRERKKSEVDSFLRKFLKFGVGIDVFEFLYMGIWVFMF